MALINLKNNHFNNESTRLSPHRIFAYKNKNFTDSNNLFYEKLNLFNLNEIQKEYSDISNIEYLYGLQQPDSFQQNSQNSSIKEINSTTRLNNTKKTIIEILSSGSNKYELSKPNISSFSNNFDNLITSKNLEIESRYFGIKRLSNEFKPFSNINEKKRIINKLYKSNQTLNDAKYQQSFNYGFYNYNSLNFFNIEASDLIKNSEILENTDREKINNNTHSCCLIYSNKKINNKNVFPGKNNSLTINFWINPRKLPKKDYYYNPGCIINIPNVISLYLMEDETKREINNSFYYLTAQLGEYSNTNQPRLEYNDRTFSTQNYLNNNNWYNITVTFNSNSISFYINNNNTNIQESFKINYLDFTNNYESIFTIGNKLNNDQSDFQYGWYALENVRKYYFNQYQFLKQSLNRNEILIDDNIDVNIQNEIFLNSKNYKLDDETFDINNTIDESFALNAELQGLIIFNTEYSNIALNDFISGKDLSFLNSENVLFYLPCCYLSIDTERESYITFGEKARIKYNSYINPYFSNTITGNEISVENFVIDFISKRKPYISGMSPIEYLDSFLKDPSVLSDDIKNRKIEVIKNVVKYNKSPNEIYNSVFTDILPFIDTENFDINVFLKNNLIYRNNFILPCDNGLNKLNLHEYISSNFMNYLNFQSGQYFNSNYMYVDISNQKNSIYENYILNQNVNKKPLSLIYFDNEFVKNSLLNDISNTGLIFKNYSTQSISKIYENYFSEIFLNKNNLLNIFDNCYNLIAFNQINYISYFTKMKSVNNENKKYLNNNIFKNFDDITNENNQTFVQYSIEKINNNGSIITESLTGNIKNFYLSNYFIEGEITENHSVVFDISNKLYSSRIRKENIQITDFDISGTGGAHSISLRDDGKGLIYRADCLTPHATWNYVGHIFYKDGLITIQHPGLSSFGENNFICELKGDHKLFTHEINVPIEKGEVNRSINKTYKKLRPSSGLYDIDEESFVYVTGINLHDENLNIVARANFSQPIVKRQNDRYNFRLKMDY